MIKEPTTAEAIRDMQTCLDNFRQAGFELLEAWEIANSVNENELTIENYPPYMPSFDDFMDDMGEKVTTL